MEVYLRSCPHRTKLGLFLLPPLYAAADLDWPDPERVLAALAELAAADRIGWDPAARVVYLRDTMQIDPPTRNGNVVKAAVSELEELPETELLAELPEDVAGAIDDTKDHHQELLAGVRARAGINHEPNGSGNGSGDGSTRTHSPHETQGETRDSNGSGNDSPNGSGNDSLIPALPAPAPATSPSLTSPAPAPAPDRSEPPAGEREVEEAWKRVEAIVREHWHLGADEIPVGSTQVGMGAERAIFLELAAAYDLEQVVGAIRFGPGVFEFEEPHSLRWYTSAEHGASNFSQASGAYFKSLRGGPAGRRGGGLRKARTGAPS